MDFSRNLGFVSPCEQHQLGEALVAIAGVGGDGGLAAEMLARMGVQRFRLADPEVFSSENLNRQNGCDATTLGLNKAKVIADIIRRINPDAEEARLSVIRWRRLTTIVSAARMVLRTRLGRNESMPGFGIQRSAVTSASAPTAS